MTEISELLTEHRSIRRFKDRPVSESLFKTIVRAAQCASTSHHVQAYSLIRVDDPDTRKPIAVLAGPQPWVEQAPLFLVVCADLTRLIACGEKQAPNPSLGWTELFMVATIDAALFAQNLMTAAESRGLGGVYIGGIRNDPETVCDLLKIPDQACPVFGMCLGYPDDRPEIKPRLPIEAILKKETFDQLYPSDADVKDNGDLDRLMQKYDETMKTYYATRSKNMKDQIWTSLMAQFIQTDQRPHMKAFLEKKGFNHR